ncbi:phenylalanine--tRNA ligase subunit beta [Candidatus Hecatella orcuttiae]|jgi:phenylalanyl-tRNA synthetase beta chain|uniref:phenylalanine--tRNA ligase subunit beta n=1 Tax=Candidatus Hecatella orcuttiae TaxID=1935119 RepID=UPI002867D2C9|nr:phenylalanine--tRNA ligase subunit beta [Candidatus Hecatella orcuttiae]
MPTVTLEKKDFYRLLGRKLSRSELEEWLPRIKCEVKNMEGEEFTVEVNADRPDMLSAEGIARALKGFLGIQTGYRPYSAKPSGVSVKVSDSVKKIRPYIACAVVRGLRMTDSTIAQLMRLQDKLDENLCRRRRKASIGVYDLDKVKPPITYTALEPQKIKFTPLEGAQPLTAREILSQTPQGLEYAHLLEGLTRFPLLVDSEGQVLSMPPIVNSEETKVTPSTRNLFIDTTSTSPQVAEKAVNILAASLWERGGRIERVQVNYPRRRIRTPRLEAAKLRLSLAYVNEVSGLNLSLREACRLAERMRLGAKATGKGEMEVLIPPYRCDVLHPIDIVEDIIIGYGYHRVGPQLPPTSTLGRELPRSVAARKLRDLMVGFGFQEVASYLLTSRENQLTKMGLEEGELVELANPMTAEFSQLRLWLLPSLMEFLSHNTHVDYPQRVFELGTTVKPDPQTDNSVKEEWKLAAAVCNYKVSYEEIQALAFEFLRLVKVENWEIRRLNHPSFIPGRAAGLRLDGKEDFAVLGEIHPQVLENFSLPNPVVALEINLSQLFPEGKI